MKKRRKVRILYRLWCHVEHVPIQLHPMEGKRVSGHFHFKVVIIINFVSLRLKQRISSWDVTRWNISAFKDNLSSFSASLSYPSSSSPSASQELENKNLFLPPPKKIPFLSCYLLSLPLKTTKKFQGCFSQFTLHISYSKAHKVKCNMKFSSNSTFCSSQFLSPWWRISWPCKIPSLSLENQPTPHLNAGLTMHVSWTWTTSSRPSQALRPKGSVLI